MRPSETLAASVVVPTIGRAGLLRSLLRSLVRCRPSADEILVVDQSGDPSVARVVRAFDDEGARLVRCDGQGSARARNVGLQEAANDMVLLTDDDCTVADDWIGVALNCLRRDPSRIVSGRVMPTAENRAVPSCKERLDPHDYTGEISVSALFTNNMAVRRDLALRLGGFDERLRNASDNDFCYRWLRAGYPLRYEPEMVVWHHDWRVPSELRKLYVAYARGQGAMYAKHLRQGDFRLLPFLVRDLHFALRGVATSWIGGRNFPLDEQEGILRGLPIGFVEGLRWFRRDDAAMPAQQHSHRAERMIPRN